MLLHNDCVQSTSVQTPSNEYTYPEIACFFVCMLWFLPSVGGPLLFGVTTLLLTYSGMNLLHQCKFSMHKPVIITTCIRLLPISKQGGSCRAMLTRWLYHKALWLSPIWGMTFMHINKSMSRTLSNSSRRG